ncbi:MAG: 30S ribosomal protein S18 [Phycisphaerae bacterium]|nr:30S ribosomal protein S18 [Phycisphaerae bacterium]
MRSNDRSGAPAKRRSAAGRDEASKCRFCREKVRTIDYKDIGTLHKMMSSQGKIFSRKRSGNCAWHQRSTRQAIKRARFIGLLPFVG